ncbi:hypothetical protein E2320_013252 [Naja naja]|nr:hypothetical protein E2320_013252 [Naja naja]
MRTFAAALWSRPPRTPTSASGPRSVLSRKEAGIEAGGPFLRVGGLEEPGGPRAGEGALLAERTSGAVRSVDDQPPSP